MTSTVPKPAAAQTYARAVAGTAIDVSCTALWTATGGLPAGRRRLARTLVIAATGAALNSRLGPPVFGTVGDPAGSRSDAGAGASGAAPAPSQPVPAPVPAPSRKQWVALGVTVGVSMTMMVVGRRLEKRWLGRLVKQGHPNPHRALALRMALVTMTGSLPSRLLEAHAALAGPADRRPAWAPPTATT